MKSILNAAQIKIVITLAICLPLISSCSKKDEEDPIGQWDDNIHLSTKLVDLESQADSVTISTEGDGWWIDAISFEDSCYTYYNREDIDLEADSYSIQEDDFIVERRNKNYLFVKMNPNNTGSDRSMYITLEAGDYFDHVTVNQSSN